MLFVLSRMVPGLVSNLTMVAQNFGVVVSTLHLLAPGLSLYVMFLIAVTPVWLLNYLINGGISMGRRSRVSPRRDKRIFSQTASRTKAINLSSRGMRGGVRL